MLLGLLLACNGGKDDADDTGGATISSVAAVIGGLGIVSDAAPSPDAETVYFLASGPWVAYAAPFDGSGTPEALASFTAPRSLVVSSDGETLYVADGDGVYAVSASGGEPTRYEETAGTSPEGLEVVTLDGVSWLYFTGLSPSGSGATGVYRMLTAGGEVETVFVGEPFYSPEGVAVSSSGTAWVCDSEAGTDFKGALIRVKDGDAKRVAAGFDAGNPCGVALASGGSTILVSAIDDEGHSQILLVNASDGSMTSYAEEIGENVGSAGMHQAFDSDAVYAWAGLSASGEGVVHRVEVE